MLCTHPWFARTVKSMLFLMFSVISIYAQIHYAFTQHAIIFIEFCRFLFAASCRAYISLVCRGTALSYRFYIYVSHLLMNNFPIKFPSIFILGKLGSSFSHQELLEFLPICTFDSLMVLPVKNNPLK